MAANVRGFWGKESNTIRVLVLAFVAATILGAGTGSAGGLPIRSAAVAWTSTPVQGIIRAIGVDSAGNVYLAGYVLSDRGVCAARRVFGILITTPCHDAFVTKLDPTGMRVLYQTILGGTSEDEATAIAVDSVGNAYVLGTTYSADFPVSANAAQRQYGGPEPDGYGMSPLSVGGDLFIAKLDSTGKLLYSTFLGGPDNEYATQIRIDAGGNAYVSGGTLSSRFSTTPGAYLVSSQSGGGVVAKISPTGTQVAWATYLGRDGDFFTAAIDLDKAGTTLYAAVGLMVTKLSRDGAYQGAFRVPGEVGGGLALDSQGNMWIVGMTKFGVAVIAKAKPDGSGLVFETRFGSGAAGARAVAIDEMDRAVVAGEATGVPVTADALLPTPPASPGFLVVFDPDGTVVYGSYALDPVVALALGGPGEIYYATDGGLVTKTILTASPLPSVGYLVNAASFGRKDRVVPGEIVSLFGSTLGPRDGVGLQLDPNGRVATSLAGTRLLFNSVPSPLLYVSDRQINAVVPFELPVGKTAWAEVEAGGQKSAPLYVDVESVAPELFTVAGSPTGQVAALNQDGTLNSPENPALQGSTISLFATGGGAFDPPLANGQLGPVPPSLLALPVYASFAGSSGEVLFAGSAPGLVAGVVQVNVRLPASLPAGSNIGVGLTIGSASSSGGSIAVR